MSTQKEIENKFEDLTGEPVYEYLRSQLKEGNELVEGRITANKTFKFNEPRKVIEIKIIDQAGNKSVYLANYSRLEREMRKKAKYLPNV